MRLEDVNNMKQALQYLDSLTVEVPAYGGRRYKTADGDNHSLNEIMEWVIAIQKHSNEGQSSSLAWGKIHRLNDEGNEKLASSGTLTKFATIFRRFLDFFRADKDTVIKEKESTAEKKLTSADKDYFYHAVLQAKNQQKPKEAAKELYRLFGKNNFNLELLEYLTDEKFSIEPDVLGALKLKIEENRGKTGEAFANWASTLLATSYHNALIKAQIEQLSTAALIDRGKFHANESDPESKTEAALCFYMAACSRKSSDAEKAEALKALQSIQLPEDQWRLGETITWRQRYDLVKSFEQVKTNVETLEPHKVKTEVLDVERMAKALLEKREKNGITLAYVKRALDTILARGSPIQAKLLEPAPGSDPNVADGSKQLSDLRDLRDQLDRVTVDEMDRKYKAARKPS